MIIDYVERLERYKDVFGDTNEILQFLEKAADLPAGKYACGDIVAMIQEGMTVNRTGGLFEIHRNNIDLQYLVDGKEIMEWAPMEQLTTAVEYDSTKDAMFLSGAGNPVEICPGMFYVMYPEDAHKACCHDEGPTAYKKVVFKIPVKLVKE